QVEIISLQRETIAIKDVLVELGKREIASLFVEGGATVNDSFLQSGHINQLILYIAPKLIGGHDAPTSFAGKGIPLLKNALQFDIVQVEQLDTDVKIVAKNMGSTPC